MSQAAAPASPSRSAWIISPLWDLLYIVATPILIVPAVLVLHDRVFSPEQISLFVMAFATLGHHLPGYMRAYGDRELFDRFKWRFLFIPPLALCVALAFSLPAMLTMPASQWAGDPSRLLAQPSWHGLELILFFWATWHGLMQTYGFMRIYDLKRGVNSIGAARFDFAICLAIFSAGVVLSDARAVSLLETLWACGVPDISPDVLVTVRQIVATGTLALIVVYLLYQFATASSPAAVNWTKLLLAATTGLLYWFSGLVTTNLIIGVALFEIFHAVQYYAIVWVYNRNRVQRVGSGFGPLGFLFRDHWLALGLYLVAIAAFGGFRWYTDGIQNDLTQRVLLALFTASTLLHYYYDGFIWKVSERRTQVDLDTAATARFDQIRVPSFVHAAKWAVFLVTVGSLAWLERQAADSPRQRAGVESYLASWFPDLPEVETRVARRKLEENDTAGAIALARHVAKMRPRSHAAHADLGKALLDDRQYAAAERSFNEALRMMPDRWEYHDFLAAALEGQGNYDAAADHYHAALALAPQETRVRIDFVRSLVHAGRKTEAMREARTAIEVAPQSWRSQLALGMAHFVLADYSASIAPLEEAARIAPKQAEPLYWLGRARFRTGDAISAERLLDDAIRLEPNHALAHYELGLIRIQAGRLQQAAESYRRCTELRPEYAEAFVHLGAALLALNEIDQAETACRRAVELSPKSAAGHYNLGVVLLTQGNKDEARRHILTAKELGQQPLPEVRAALGL